MMRAAPPPPPSTGLSMGARSGWRPATADAPQVVNNSVDIWPIPAVISNLRPDLQALRASGILPVFAAGNGGPYPTPATARPIIPRAFAVGAINNSGTHLSVQQPRPIHLRRNTSGIRRLVAPGVNIHTSDLYGGLLYCTAAPSISAPHVAGVLALLLSAYPNLSRGRQESALTNSALDQGVVGPDNIYGYGRVDALAAFNWLAAAPTATSTLEPTLTATPEPATVTSTDLPPTETPTALPPSATPTALPPTETPTALPPSATPTALPPTEIPTALPPSATATPLPPTENSHSFTTYGDCHSVAADQYLRPFRQRSRRLRFRLLPRQPKLPHRPDPPHRLSLSIAATWIVLRRWRAPNGTRPSGSSSIMPASNLLPMPPSLPNGRMALPVR